MKIAFMGDLHYPTVNYANTKVKKARDTFYEEYLRAFFEVEADYYVSIGDLANYGNEDEFREIYQIVEKYNKNFIHVFGNHDLYGIPRQEVLNITKMKQNFSIETEKANLLFLETARDHDFEDYGGFLNEEQLQMLEKEIDNSGVKPVIIFAHHPVYNTTVRSNLEFLSIEPESPIRNILQKKQGTGIYVNGHNHEDSIVTIGNWTFIQACDVLDDPSIRIIDVQNDQITIKAETLNNPELNKLAEIIGINVPSFQLNKEGIGTAPNRETVIKQNVESFKLV